MYGSADVPLPRRIVCLAPEHVEICYALGAGDRVVAVPAAATRPPEASGRPQLTGGVGAVLALDPDLVLASPDSHGDLVADLIRSGANVLSLAPRSVDEILGSIALVGGALGLAEAAGDLVQDMRDEIRQVREYSSMWPRRPRVYLESSASPLATGGRWISEILDLAGGRDVFSDRRGARTLAERVVDAADVVARDPEIVIAAWPLETVDVRSIATRSGWQETSAVTSGRVFALDPADILYGGPSVLAGLRHIHELVQSCLEDPPPGSPQHSLPL